MVVRSYLDLMVESGALSVRYSHSRLRVSNDNPFSASQVKTSECRHDYPRRFGDIVHSGQRCSSYVEWYNLQRHHSGLSGFTLEKTFTGRYHAIAKVRQKALDQSFEAHPERFTRGRPKLAMPPVSIPINPVQPDDDSRVPYSVVNFSTLSAAVDTARKSTIILKDLSESGAQVQAIARFLVSIQRFLVQTLYRKWRRNWAISLNYVGQQWRAGDK